jgi:predicted transposase
MKTIKIEYKTSQETIDKIKELQRQFSCVVRFAYNRFLENKTEKEIRILCKNLKNIQNLDSWFIQCAIKQAEQIYKKFGNKKVVFGGKKNLFQRIKRKISNEEYKEKRLMNVISQGEKLQYGNRKFKLDILENNKIIFKLNRKNHFELELPKLHENYLREFLKLEELSKNKNTTYSVVLNSKEICISYEEKILQKEINSQNENRCLGIDLNPEFIGISILEFKDKENFQIIHKQCFDLRKLTVKSDEAPNSKQSKYLQNKLKYETIEIAKQIFEIAKFYNCKYIFAEHLKNFKPFDFKSLNRLCRQKWLKNLFIEQLQKRCLLNNIKFYKVLAQYTSIIGNLQYNFFDPINASIEIARRGYQIFHLRNKKILSYIQNQRNYSPTMEE